MTTVEAPVAPEHIEAAGGQQLAPAIPTDPLRYTQCASYKEAKVLAVSRRREGTHAYAVFVVALDCWCVR